MAIPQPRLDQIRDLVNQWEQLVGYSVTVPDWAVEEMASTPSWWKGGQISSLFDVGQYMDQRSRDGGGSTVIPWDSSKMPWAVYGMNVSEWSAKLDAFGNVYGGLTGQGSDVGLFESLLQQLHGQGNEAEFRTLIQADPRIRDTYGWVKFGLDYQSFREQKDQMRLALGQDVDDKQAVLQLQYSHRAQGGGSEVSVQSQLQADQKRQAAIGPAQSEVR